MSWTEVKSIATEDPIILVPIGAIEQHGPHLPIHEDSIVADWSANYIATQLKNEIDILVAPALNYGHSPTFRGYAGNLSLAQNTLRLVVGEILDGLVASGFRRIVLIDNNGGNVAPITSASLDARQGHGILVGHLYPWQLGYGLMRDAYDDASAVYGHGAEPEHSAMLAMFPEQVHSDSAVKRPFTQLAGWNPTSYTEAKIGNNSVPGTVFWDFSEISDTGVSGDPTVGTQAMGELWIERVMGFCCDYVREYNKNTQNGACDVRP
ncbi:creatininase family protein [Spelaeicoccus albus]|uniref:Creatinine amidohydrolase n=2 Tax=Spelaeicoccus albus TaxID=1280376 RepID=A0A7Z0D4L9_9MICO|nr:creatinine amidohydrolase [Spelaeicoccus albus]